jgi:ribosomal protein S18 acetylase RimI-like enzyme
VPEAFGSSFEEESIMLEAAWQEGLKKNNIWGAFVDEALVGCIGFRESGSVKTRHKGIVWGMYVQPAHCGRGIANRLLEALIAFARLQVTQLILTVVTTNKAAIALYRKYGFEIYGTELSALQIGTVFYDEYSFV